MHKTAKIIVVDDEQRICQNVAKILSNQNYEVVQAASAEEALKKLAGDSFSLLISDIVMPGMNGLELLKLVKNQWPLTKAVMITGYASTDTAAKAIRLGALDYLPKPFTPDELRKIVDLALEEKLLEAAIPETERQAIDTKTTKPLPARSTIDVDIPFDRAAVEESVGEPYANALGRSDLPVFEQPATETLESYCRVGNIFCDVFKKHDATCKVGRKSGECPKKKAQDKKGRGQEMAFDVRELIGIDVPFNYEEVVSVTGPEYVTYLNRDGMSFVPFEELKKRLTSPEQAERAPEVDRPELPEAPVLHSILVIDDEPSVNNNIRKILLKKGYTVDQALTKREALEQIERRAYKVILLDLKIPGVNGLELLAAIREKSPESRVIIITGYATIETAKETARLGAVDYLAKPFTPEEIRISTENAFRYAA